MKKNRIKSIVLHIVNDPQQNIRTNNLNEFHVQMIKQRLNQSNLTSSQKIIIIDKIIENLKSREVNGIIK